MLFAIPAIFWSDVIDRYFLNCVLFFSVLSPKQRMSNFEGDEQGSQFSAQPAEASGFAAPFSGFYGGGNIS